MQKEKPGKGRAEEKEGRQRESETRVRNRVVPVPLQLNVPHDVTPFVPHSPQVSSALFFQYNTQLGPPYHILVDTNFINFSIQNKLDVVQSMMDCLYAKCEQVTARQSELCNPHDFANIRPRPYLVWFPDPS